MIKDKVNVLLCLTSPPSSTSRSSVRMMMMLLAVRQFAHLKIQVQKVKRNSTATLITTLLCLPCASVSMSTQHRYLIQQERGSVLMFGPWQLWIGSLSRMDRI